MSSVPSRKPTRPIHRVTKVILITGLAVALLVICGLKLLSLGAKRPDNLGVQNGLLASCPDSPNCVSSQATSAGQLMPPITFTGDADRVIELLQTIMTQMGGVNVVLFDANYLYCESRTPFFGFVDDIEFLVDREESMIHFRSAARVGYDDLGVNRRRMNVVRRRFAESAGATDRAD